MPDLRCRFCGKQMADWMAVMHECIPILEAKLADLRRAEEGQHDG